MKKLDTEDESRKRFFDHMHGFQVKNDIRSQNLKNYMEGRDLATLSRLDEEKYMKAMQDKQVQDAKNDLLERQKNANSKNSNALALQQQMLDRQNQNKLLKYQDESFAALLRQQV